MLKHAGLKKSRTVQKKYEFVFETAAQFLDALRGARLEVHSGSESASGRLLSIDEREIPIKGDQKVTVDQISIVSDSGLAEPVAAPLQLTKCQPVAGVGVSWTTVPWS